MFSRVEVFRVSKVFRMNTYISVSKQRTLSFFRMNTYAKLGGQTDYG
jgi:hypothetical protein